jgi:seryl-tRNA synthetase
MGDARRSPPAALEAFGAALVADGLLVPMGVPGLYGGSAALEAVIDGVDRLVLRAGATDGAEGLRFPPTIPRRVLERSDYLRSFPHLTGTVYGFSGNEAEHAALLERLDHGEGWWAGLDATDVVLTPAACYPVYPALAGMLPRDGRLIDVCSHVFRREPSRDPTRLQSFRMHEQVRAGTPEQCLAHRDRWIARGLALLRALELPGEVRPANDPFFGRAGRMLASNQRELELKLELVVPIGGSATACASFNYHQDHFGAAFGIRTTHGEVAHTACIGFGLERMALALLWHHGRRPDRWPLTIRELIGT